MGTPHSALVPIEWLLVIQIVVLLAGTGVHELGHALAARAMGFRVLGARVGPLVAVAGAAGWRLRVTWEVAVGGELLSLPPEPEGLRGRHAAMIAAGPAAHLLASAAMVGAAAATGALLLWFAAATLGVGALANLVPGRSRFGGRWTDGRWLLAWAAHPERAAQRVGLGALQRSAMEGRRPREWDERWARLAASGPRRPVDGAQVAGRLLAYARALDAGDARAAGPLLARAFAGRHLLPAGARASLSVEVAFFAARFRGRARFAACLLESAATRSRHVPVADLERAWAAVHLAAGRPAEGAAACDRALEALPGAGVRPAALVALDRSLVEALRRDAVAGTVVPDATGAGWRPPPDPN